MIQKPAAPIIVIDLQTAMFRGRGRPLHDADGLVSRVRDLMAWARRSGRKIGFVRHDGPVGDQMEPGAPGWVVYPALGQGAGDPTFGKSVGNAFSNPHLVDWVAESGEVVLVGAATDHCVAASVKGAMAAGLKVTVVSDAHSTGGETAPAIIAEHNAAFAASGATLVTTRALIAS